MAALSPNFDPTFEDGGVPAAGYLLHTYATGTTTPLATYQDQAGTIPNTNPIVLDAAGRAKLWLSPSAEYRLLLTTPLGATVSGYPIDDVGGVSTALDAAGLDAALRADLASTAAGDGAAMIGLASPVVASIAELRTLLKTSPAQNAFVTSYYGDGLGGGGHYWCDAGDTTTADDGGAVIVAADGGRWKLVCDRPSVKQFGAVGNYNGVTGADDTAAFQAAINYVQSHMTLNTSLGPALGAQQLYHEPGRYKITSTLGVSKKIAFVGDRGAEYSTGARIVKTTSGDLYRLDAAGGGVSFAFDGLTLLSDVPGTGNLINVVAGSPGWNSWRVSNCCFMNPQQFAIIATGDDVRISGNTFDVSGYSGELIQVGTPASRCSNISISNNDFFNIPLRPILVFNTRGCSVVGNIVSQAIVAPTDPANTTVTFVEAGDTFPTLCEGLVITGNTMYGTRRVANLRNSVGSVISSNTSYSSGFGAAEVYDAISLAGTNVGTTVTGNSFSGDYGPRAFVRNSGTAIALNINGNSFVGPAADGIICGAMTGDVSGNSYAGITQEVVASDYYAVGYVKRGTQSPAYGPSIVINAIAGEEVIIIATDAVAFSILDPTNPSNGQQITLQIYNNTAGALGALTFGPAYRLAAWVQPGPANSRLITFRYSSGLVKWVEVSRTTDVPN